MPSKPRVLLLTVGYGQGHISAATALEEYYASQGWQTLVDDPCEDVYPYVYSITRAYYQFCVRRAPWMWGITYARTDTSDWAKLARGSFLKQITEGLLELLHSWRPDLVLCTYPLYAYMLDSLAEQGKTNVPYAVVVTDALEISKPWMKSHAPIICVPDEYSVRMVMERYGHSTDSVVATGFPVRRAFRKPALLSIPTPDNLRIIYGVYRSVRVVKLQIEALFAAFPLARVTMLGGHQTPRLAEQLRRYIEDGRLLLMSESRDMPSLFSQHHLYIGKTGAATMFEAYASGVPIVANFALPGQEQGNLDLLLRDDAGCWVESEYHLVSTLRDLLDNGAERWLVKRNNMLNRPQRVSGAESVYRLMKERFSLP